MAHGIELTLQLINKSKNRSASGLLESAFQSTNKHVRDVAGTVLVSNKSGVGFKTIIRNFNADDEDVVALVQKNREKLIPDLRNAITDPTLFPRAFCLAYTQGFYEVLPALVSFCLNPESLQKHEGHDLDQMLEDVLRFIDKYTLALDDHDVNDYHMLYNIVFLELGQIMASRIKDYHFNHYEPILSVLIRLYPFLSSEIVQHEDLIFQLQHADTLVYLAVRERLLQGVDEYMIRFVIRCLDRGNPPLVVRQLLAERYDVPFLSAILSGIKKPVSLQFKKNLSNLSPLPWLNPKQIGEILPLLGAESQCGLVVFLQNMGMAENNMLAFFEHILKDGRSEARLEVLSTLSGIPGQAIDQIFWDIADDKDPAVQIVALTQLHTRNVPSSISRIVQFADSPHEEVRFVVGRLLPHFRFDRFMQTFDKLDDSKRRQMFDVVRQLDRTTPIELTQMLRSSEPIVRAKALLCIGYSHAIVPLVEDVLCEVLEGESMPKLRCKAAEHLVAGQKSKSRMSLVNALHRDNSPEVRAAAKNSLENRPAHGKPNEGTG